MYIHLGGELVLPVRDVVAILDARLVEASAVNRELVDRAARARRLRGPGLGPACKAVVLGADMAVYTSPVAPRTLARRIIHLRRSAEAWDAER